MSLLERMRRKFGKRIKTHENYQTVFTTPQGAEVLAHLLKEGFFFKTTAVRDALGNVDVNQTLLNEGKRMLALSVFKYVYKDHTNVVQQVEEQLKQYENE